MNYTFNHRVEAELVIKKSRFISIGVPIFNENDAKRQIENMRKEFYDARHIAYAYRFDDGQLFQKSSDDGEPSGTAGKPILNFMIKENIVNAIVFVVRYFGGIKLGAGGLTRAYSGTAVLLKDNLVKELKRVNFSCSIQDAGRVIKLLDANLVAYEKRFSSECEISALCEDIDALVKILSGVVSIKYDFITSRGVNGNC